jgi:transposase
VIAEQHAAFEQLVASRIDWTLQSLAAAWQEQTGITLLEAIGRLYEMVKLRPAFGYRWL